MIANEWSFPVSINGDLAFGKQASITIGLPDTAQSDTTFLSKVSYCVESFIALAGTGALGSSALNPSSCKAVVHNLEAVRTAHHLTWNIDELCIDNSGVVVLLNMLDYLAGTITGVQINAQGATYADRLPRESTIGIWSNLPFSADVEPVIKNVEVEIEFKVSIPDHLRETIVDAIQVWIDCGTISGYQDDPLIHSCLSPIDYPAIKLGEDSINVQYESINLHDMTCNILLNLLTKISAMVPIRSVEIS